jgi:hypothetical protein
MSIKYECLRIDLSSLLKITWNRPDAFYVNIAGGKSFGFCTAYQHGGALARTC